MTIADLKAVLRRSVMARRRDVHHARHLQAGGVLAERVFAEVPAAQNRVAGYWPLGEEIDCRPALISLQAGGAAIGLPVVAGQGQVLIFRAWQPGDVLESGPFGTSHPTNRAPLLIPTVLLLPVLAYDSSGHRLGYGAGYYDRTVAALRRDHSILSIGIAYDEQEVDQVPADDHDQKMDAVITDKRALWFNPAVKPQRSAK
jgi:5-formyltetrahydrofolate cyclo-ligase